MWACAKAALAPGNGPVAARDGLTPKLSVLMSLLGDAAEIGVKAVNTGGANFCCGANRCALLAATVAKRLRTPVACGDRVQDTARWNGH